MDSQPLDDARISSLIEYVMRELGDADPLAAPTQRAPQHIPFDPRPGDGMFPDPDSAVAAAQEAFEQ